MHTPRPRPGPPHRLRLPRRTARLRLTVLYGAAFLACGAAVLAVVAYLLYASTTSSSNQPKTTASAVLNAPIPIADVHQAGRYDIVPIRIPIADVHQAGRYDTVSISLPASAGQQSHLTAAEQAKLAAEKAKLLARAQVHVNYDKREILI
ncbi:MAG: hypothetical protein ACRDPF_15510, partial [Streptosporangiaceae bacterium]